MQTLFASRSWTLIAPNRIKYLFFIDETGDHGLTFIDDNFPLFLLAGCLIDSQAYSILEQQINRLKEEIFHSTSVILHSRDIRKCEGSFQVFFDLQMKQKFYDGLSSIIRHAPFQLIGVGVDKAKHIAKHGKAAGNPYSICLSYLLERLIFCLDEKTGAHTVSILVERRGRAEDTQLMAHYKSIIETGTLHIRSERFKNRIERFDLLAKKENIIGLQLADLCAYPLARHLLNSTEPYIPFEVIKSKLYDLKLFP